MNKTKIISTFLVVLLIISTTLKCFASGVNYLPDVTSEMSSPSFWTDETDILMSYRCMKGIPFCTGSFSKGQLWNPKGRQKRPLPFR